ncbi:MAG: nitroreductase family protein [Eubacteriales bacterium]|nr:nitroreductase family protein [Eubacteriales bacterium]
MNSATIIEAIKNRRSCRKFKPETPKRSEIEIVLDCANHSPTGMNRQNLQFTALLRREEITLLAGILSEILDRRDYHFYHAPCLILVSAPLDHPYPDLDVGAAMENLYLACEGLGLGMVWINQFHDECSNPQLRAALDSFEIPSHHAVQAAAAIGYPDAAPSALERTMKIVIRD